ncbi:MAG: tetratricopeptide repeat protein, partial [Candidatus Rokubacteria bacterium]|nr:tetratricopeptide repeat protein [Candidatus Rokubacteria bacterium]
MLARWLSKGILALGVASLLYSGIPPAAWGIGEADRLWLVGEGAFADRLYAVSRRSLERFVKNYPNEARVGEATLLLGKSQFALGEFQPALENFRKAQRLSPSPGRPEEARFWEAETLFRLKRYA